MNCHATFLIKWLPAGMDYFDFLLEKSIAPEVGMEHGGLEYPPAGHRELAARLAGRGLTAAVHLPFFGLIPGSADTKLWRKSVDRLLRAAEIASIYGVSHLIGHPEFPPPYSNGRDWWAANRPDEAWLERSTRAWEELLQATDVPLYLENTDDQTPEAILSLLERLPRRVGFCFDIGHWHFAARGRDRRNLADWLTPIAASGRLAHLHLHDNDGEADRHWGLGRGIIDFHQCFALLNSHSLKPTFTLESHRLDSLRQSLAWLENKEEI